MSGKLFTPYCFCPVKKGGLSCLHTYKIRGSFTALQVCVVHIIVHINIHVHIQNRCDHLHQFSLLLHRNRLAFRFTALSANKSNFSYNCFVLCILYQSCLTITAGTANCPILGGLGSNLHLLWRELGSLTCLRVTLPRTIVFWNHTW